MKLPLCTGCGKPWHKHDGIVHTCRKLAVARRTLASLRSAKLTPRQVIRLARTLDETA